MATDGASAPAATAQPDLTPLLAPASVAVIGASDAPGNLGGVAVRLLRKFGYPGQIWPVHPRGRAVAGLTCYAAIADLPGVADMAIIALAPERVVDMVRQCAAAGTRAGVVWAGGFSETGGAGISLQRELESVCRRTSFKLLGPNCIGVMNSAQPMTATFASVLADVDSLLPGTISMASQSGGMLTMTLASAQNQGTGFRYAVSTGNEAVLCVADFIHAFADDAGTDVIAVYLEGTRDGGRLVHALEAARQQGKPVVTLKGGRSSASAVAVAAHTGALAGEGSIWDAVLRELGVIQVFSQEELVDVVLALAAGKHGQLPTGNRMAVVTFGGGSGVVSIDQCAAVGLATQPLTDETRSMLAKLSPPGASLGNPIDLTPQTYTQPVWRELFPQVLDAISADKGIDAVLMQSAPMVQGGPAIAEAIADYCDRSAKPVLVSWPLPPPDVPAILAERRIHYFNEYDRAIRVAGKLVRYGQERARWTRWAGERSGPASAFPWASFVPAPSPGLILMEDVCHAILEAYGLPTAAGRLASTEHEAEAAATRLGYPVALKAITPSVSHRAAEGLVRLGVETEREVSDAYRQLSRRASELAEFRGVYVQQMTAPGTEILLSGFRDPTFGVFVSCAAGGILTEVLDDVAIASAPFGFDAARSMLADLRIGHALSHSGAGGRIDGLASYVSRFSELVSTAPWQRFVLELNPIMWRGDEAVAIDGLLIVQAP